MQGGKGRVTGEKPCLWRAESASTGLRHISPEEQMKLSDTLFPARHLQSCDSEGTSTDLKDKEQHSCKTEMSQ